MWKGMKKQDVVDVLWYDILCCDIYEKVWYDKKKKRNGMIKYGLIDMK